MSDLCQSQLITIQVPQCPAIFTSPLRPYSLYDSSFSLNSFPMLSAIAAEDPLEEVVNLQQHRGSHQRSAARSNMVQSDRPLGDSFPVPDVDSVANKQ